MSRSIEENLHPDEPWFTLRGKDMLAPHAVLVYAALCRAAAAGLEHGDAVHTGDDRQRCADLRELAQDAEKVAAGMVAWQSSHPELAKLPD